LPKHQQNIYFFVYYSPRSMEQILGKTERCGKAHKFTFKTEISWTSAEIWEIRISEILTCFKAGCPAGPETLSYV